MSDREFSLGGRDFKLCKIDAFKQFHIVRRIGPLLSDLLPAMKDLSGLRDKTDQIDQAAKVLGPIMTGLSKLSDADADLVLFGLLASVEMKQSSGNWAKVATSSMLMIQDLDLPTMLQLAGRAFAFNLTGFFTELPRQ